MLDKLGLTDEQFGALKTSSRWRRLLELHAARRSRIEVEDRTFKVDLPCGVQARVQDALKDMPILKDSQRVSTAANTRRSRSSMCRVLDPLLVADEGFSWSISDARVLNFPAT